MLSQRSPIFAIVFFYSATNVRALVPPRSTWTFSSAGLHAYRSSAKCGMIGRTAERRGVYYMSKACLTKTAAHTVGTSILMASATCCKEERSLTAAIPDARGKRHRLGRKANRGMNPAASPVYILRAAVTVAAATTACSGSVAAALTGGRIGGGYTGARENSRPSAPPIQQQQPYYQRQSQREYTPPQAGRDIYGSAGSRVHIEFGDLTPGARKGRRARAKFNPDTGDLVATRITPGDVAMITGVSAVVAAMQRRNRNRYLEEKTGEDDANGSPSSARGVRKAAVVTTMQVALYCERKGGREDVLGTLDALSQNADVTSPGGLSVLVNEVCLTLLRAEKDWVGTTGGVKEYTPEGRSSRDGKRDENTSPKARAKRDFNRAVTRERSKWERETVSNTPERGFSTSRAPGWRGSEGTPAGTYAVATLMVAWAGLRSTPPQPAVRTGSSWWWQDGKKDSDGSKRGFSVENRQSAVNFLEWLGDEAAEGRGENVLDLEVLWTPADVDDSLDRDDLYTKWPELRGV